MLSNASAQAPICRTTNAPPFHGELRRISPSGDVLFKTDAGDRTVAAADIITWGELRDSADGTQVLLADGSVIVASGVKLDGESLVVDANLFGRPQGFSIAGATRLPVSAVKAIVFRVPLKSAQRDALFDRIAAAKGNEDQLWLANGDAIAGSLTSLEPAAVAVKTAAGPVEIRPDEPRGRLLEKVSALIFNPLLTRRAPEDGRRMLAGLADGSRLFVKQFKTDGEQVRFDLVCGVSLVSHPDENIWRQITALESFGGGVRYLSELPPKNYRHTPLLERSWPLGVDRSAAGGRLRCGGRLYARGLGMHSTSAVLFVLDQPYRRFEAELAVDESAGDLGSVQCVVATYIRRKVDGVVKTETKELAKSAIVRGGDEPLPISVDLSGVSNLVLFVTAADRGAQMDRADWLNARLIQ